MQSHSDCRLRFLRRSHRASNASESRLKCVGIASRMRRVSVPYASRYRLICGAFFLRFNIGFILVRTYHYTKRLVLSDKRL